MLTLFLSPQLYLRFTNRFRTAVMTICRVVTRRQLREIIIHTKFRFNLRLLLLHQHPLSSLAVVFLTASFYMVSNGCWIPTAGQDVLLCVRILAPQILPPWIEIRHLDGGWSSIGRFLKWLISCISPFESPKNKIIIFPIYNEPRRLYPKFSENVFQKFSMTPE